MLAKIVKYVFAKPFTKRYDISHGLIFQGISCCAIRTSHVPNFNDMYVLNQFGGFDVQENNYTLI